MNDEEGSLTVPSFRNLSSRYVERILDNDNHPGTRGERSLGYSYFPPIHIVYDVYRGKSLIVTSFRDLSSRYVERILDYDNHPGTRGERRLGYSHFPPIHIVYDVYGGKSLIVTLFRDLSSRLR